MGNAKHHYKENKTNEWLTPPEIIERLGPFDLDPCAPVDRPWDMAEKHYTKNDDGLSKDWNGRVWLNPPYGKQAYEWIEKLADHGNGIALLFARTETKSFWKDIWGRADSLFFLKGRIYFYKVDGTRANNNSGAPSVFVAYGTKNTYSLMEFDKPGVFVPEWSIKDPMNK